MPQGIEPKYLLYFLRKYEPKLASQGKGSTFASITQKDIKRIPVPLPSPAEQKRVVSFLDQADSLRGKRKKAMKLLDEYVQSVFIEMFGDPVINPRAWKIYPISDVCSEIVDCVNRTATVVEHSTDYKMLRTTNIRERLIDTENVRYVDESTYRKWTRRSVPQKGDIVFTREAPVGNAGVIDFDDQVFLGQRTMQFRPSSDKANSYFLLFELTSAGILKQIDSMSAGSTVKHLSVPECKQFQIRVPPIEMQNQFGAIYLKAKQISQRMLEQAEELENQFNALMQKTFQ